MREERRDDARLMAAWLAGETGHPLVDAAMRDLTANGWINFRLRQLLCSYAIDLLDLDLHKVGVALGELFDDFCPGIHWPQIGLQAGMMAGRGPRVLNPVKQAQELDPSGAYVRSMLPHLASIPTGGVFEPWRLIGYRGPRPIVDYATASRAARNRHAPTRRA
jgi:deoxyribodipyrimidine photo-lyase